MLHTFKSITHSNRNHFESMHINPNSDQHQISPGNINAFLIPEVIRIKEIIIQGEFS